MAVKAHLKTFDIHIEILVIIRQLFLCENKVNTHNLFYNILFKY